MTDMKSTKLHVLMRICYIFTIVRGEMLSSAYMIQEPNIHADTTDQTDERTDQLAMLTKRIDEFEQSRVKDVDELNLRIQELSELHKNDALALTKLNDEVEKQKRLRVKDLHLITVLAAKIESLERHCGNEHSEKETHILQRDETPYHNRSDLSLLSPAASIIDNSTTKEEDLLTRPADTPRSEIKTGQGRIRSRQHGRITRVSAAEDTVAFHAILSHTRSDLAANQAVIFDKLVTNSGKVHYNSNTGIFTTTQSGIHVFSWAIGVPHNEYVSTELVKNNVVIGSATTGEGTYYSSTSATSAVHLEVGDNVWVRVVSVRDGSVIQGARSMFTGFRVG